MENEKEKEIAVAVKANMKKKLLGFVGGIGKKRGAPRKKGSRGRRKGKR